MYIAVSHALEQQIAVCIARQTQTWESSLKNEDTEDSKRRLFPSLSDPPIPCVLHTRMSGYTGTYRHPTGATFTIQISNNGLIADLQDRVILFKMSLVHASGKFFVGSIRNAGFDLIPPFAVDSILMLWAWRKELAFFWNLLRKGKCSCLIVVILRLLCCYARDRKRARRIHTDGSIIAQRPWRFPFSSL